MTGLNEQQRTALEAVARRLSATSAEGSGSHDVSLVVAGKRVPVDIAPLRRPGPGRAAAKAPRLRFDKVVIRLLERLEASLREVVPDGTTVLLTITAPIHLPSRTAVALEARVQALLLRRSRGRDEKVPI